MAERQFRRDTPRDNHDAHSVRQLPSLSRPLPCGNEYHPGFNEGWEYNDPENSWGESPLRSTNPESRQVHQQRRGSGDFNRPHFTERPHDVSRGSSHEYQRHASIESDYDEDHLRSHPNHHAHQGYENDRDVLIRMNPRPSSNSWEEEEQQTSSRHTSQSPYSKRAPSVSTQSSELYVGSSRMDLPRRQATQGSSFKASYRPTIFPMRPDTASTESNTESESNYRMSKMPLQYEEDHLLAASYISVNNTTFNQSPLPAIKDQTFRYAPLGESEIRLIKVLPETKTMIKCEMRHVSLRNPPRYVAISYAWGDARETRNIDLQGFIIPLSISLHGALQALRLKSESVFVWADALSINQQNKEERTQQVQLMTNIYSSAQSVAVWLGPEEDNSTRALDLICEVSKEADSSDSVASLLTSRIGNGDLLAVISLYMRDYWKRLWIVQELFNARNIVVYCGPTSASWSNYELAADAFRGAAANLDRFLTKEERRNNLSWNGYSSSQVLYHHGPTSLLDLKTDNRGKGALLEALRKYREKLALDPRDKLFGILGILPEDVRKDFRANYDLSVKDVYVEVVDYVLKTTQCLDIICDAIHFPVYTSAMKLPSFVPDWSYNNDVESIAGQWDFSAAGSTHAQCSFVDERLNKLKIAAIYLGTVRQNGVSVGTIYRRDDFLMAFLHWRAILLDRDNKRDRRFRQQAQQDFASSLCFGQDPLCKMDPEEWLVVCYNVFANLLRKQLPHLPLDSVLQAKVSHRVHKSSLERVQFFKDHFQYPMIGRCLCLTDDLVGLGSGFMVPGDIVVVPLGCSTPIILRSEGTRDEYRFVGDVYINGYMHGEAVDEWKSGKRELTQYFLH